MSVLAPLYLLGALAVSLPILFHLIRRRPTGAIEFSSLMFLQPTPPRLTRRSRLENWPLLLMRALALILLAIAFARPFLRQPELASSAAAGKRTVLVIDKSASMQRPGLWEKARDEAAAIVNRLSPQDQLAIVAFDQEPDTIFSFEQSADLDADQRKQAALLALRDISPSWLATNTGRAISYAADMVTEQEVDNLTADDATTTDAESHLKGNASLMLVSDMQQGSQIESLQQYAWPKTLTLQIRRVSAEKRTNAAAQILADGQFAETSDRIRVRVSNAADSETSRFRLTYVNSDAGSGQDRLPIELPVQVPPGESRVVRMPIPDPSVTSLLIHGDEQSFDNQRFLVSREPAKLSLLFIGPAVHTPEGDVASGDEFDESDARQSLLYYLQRVPLTNRFGEVTVTTLDSDALADVPSVATTPLIVVAESVSTDVSDRLKEYVAGGGRVLFVLPQVESDSLQNAITTSSQSPIDSFAISESDVADYAMLTDIQFTHPVFQPMADPKFNDFTKIRFWSHRSIQNVPENWSVLANFDDGQPALLEYQNGDGRIWVLSAGWQPVQSQLALSTKFLPLIYSFFGRLSGRNNTTEATLVSEMPPYRPMPNATITGPSGVVFDFSQSDDVHQIDRPGIYTYKSDDLTGQFAVNLAPSESVTTAMDNEVFERFGVKLGQATATMQGETLQRQLRDVELEKQQKIWQWLLAGALALLAIETLWGGLLSRGGASSGSATTANTTS